MNGKYEVMDVVVMVLVVVLVVGIGTNIPALVSATTKPTPIFADGFETGTEPWSAVVGATPTTYHLGDVAFGVIIDRDGADNVRLLLTGDMPFTTFTWEFAPHRPPVAAVVGVPVVVPWPCAIDQPCTFTPAPIQVRFTITRTP